jgi:hypothetical protein
MARFEVKWIAVVETAEGFQRNEPSGPPQLASIVNGAIEPATAGLKRALQRKGSGVRLLALNVPETSELWRGQPRPE